MTWLFSRLLPIAGPAWFALRGALPSLGLIKGVMVGLAFAAFLGAGGYVGWTLHAWGEAPRLAKAKKEAVVRAIQQAEIEAKTKALEKASATIDERQRSLDESAARNTQLTQTLEALRAKSFHPDEPVLLADDPWLRDRPASGGSVRGMDHSDRGNKDRVPRVRYERPGGR